MLNFYLTFFMFIFYYICFMNKYDFLDYKSLINKVNNNNYRQDLEKYEINKQNVKILQRIVDARQVNVRSREDLMY